MKVALVYDRINKWGGAERLLLAFHKIFPDAPLYTAIRNNETSEWANVFKVRTSFLNHVFSRQREAFVAPFTPIAFENFSFDDFDLVVSITSDMAKGIITKPTTKHVCYCLTPPRYLLSQDQYFRNKLSKLVTKPIVSYIRSWDQIASRRPDSYIAISTEVKKRIENYYGLSSEIIYPPVMLERPHKIKKTSEKFFLFVSRFSRYNHYKKADLAIDAFNQTGKPLKIIGGGPLLSSLKKKAGKTIDFIGEVSDEDLASYYINSEALVFPGLEDYGMVMAEAISFGTPVIAYKKGGALDIVTEGKTGIFFDKQDRDSLIGALEKFKTSSYNKSVIEDYSKRFSFDRFKAQLLQHLNTL